jgi:hypothetical protein
MAFHDDLSRLGLRRRRHYDTRRTFISLAQADGARKDVLRWVTHGPTGKAFDAYTTLPWATLCEAVGYLRLGLREGKLVSIPGAGAIAKPLPVGDGLETEASGVEAQKERAASSVACGP